MKNNLKYKKFFVFIILGFLIVGLFLGLHVLRNKDSSKNEDTTSINPSNGTITMFEWTPYGGITAGSPLPDPNEQDSLEWTITTIYGPGFTWYMMNDTEFSAIIALPAQWRTRGNFSYTALLSDEDVSASGTFYPQYEDKWWLVTINHWFGFNCSASYTDNWKDDSITVDEPTNSRSWEANTSQYINWTWDGDFNYVDIDLYHDGNFSRNIATNAQNNGSYLWSIHDDILLFDDLYQVNISNNDFAATWDISDPYFEINEIDSIDVSSPITSSSWETGTTHSITWISTGTITDVKIELFKSGILESEIISSTPNDGNFSWIIPSGLDNSTQYQIKISDVSNSPINDYSDYFEIYTSPSISESPDIPGYDTTILLGISFVSVIGVIYLLRKKKKVSKFT